MIACCRMRRHRAVAEALPSSTARVPGLVFISLCLLKQLLGGVVDRLAASLTRRCVWLLLLQEATDNSMTDEVKPGTAVARRLPQYIAAISGMHYVSDKITGW